MEFWEVVRSAIPYGNKVLLRNFALKLGLDRAVHAEAAETMKHKLEQLATTSLREIRAEASALRTRHIVTHTVTQPGSGQVVHTKQTIHPTIKPPAHVVATDFILRWRWELRT